MGLPRITRRKVGMTQSRHGRYAWGDTPAQMAGTEGSESAMTSKSRKAGFSPDWSLQLGSMKVESLVIVDQHATVNTFPGLVHTDRRTTKVGCSRSGCANLREAGRQGMADNWGEVVTR